MYATPIADAKCPQCDMTNANADPEAALAEMQQREGLRPCPACPDGNVWGADGPTGKPCPVCLGFAEVNLDGSPTDEARESARRRQHQRIGVSYRQGERE